MALSRWSHRHREQQCVRESRVPSVLCWEVRSTFLALRTNTTDELVRVPFFKVLKRASLSDPHPLPGATVSTFTLTSVLIWLINYWVILLIRSGESNRKSRSGGWVESTGYTHTAPEGLTPALGSGNKIFSFKVKMNLKPVLLLIGLGRGVDSSFLILCRGNKNKLHCRIAVTIR